MAQEFFINSQELENKVRQLLPSQGGAGAGFDLSASTQIVPIIDLTEQAEGSNLRQDLQRAYGLGASNTSVVNATSTIIDSTGYWLLNGVVTGRGDSSGVISANVTITDGTTSKLPFAVLFPTGAVESIAIPFERVVKCRAGESITIATDSARLYLTIQFRQIADISGNLVDPI